MSLHLRAVYEGGVFRPLEPVDIAEHQEVVLVLETQDDVSVCADAEMPIWRFAERLARRIPESELSALPTDGAARHNRYLCDGPERDRCAASGPGL